MRVILNSLINSHRSLITDSITSPPPGTLILSVRLLCVNFSSETILRSNENLDDKVEETVVEGNGYHPKNWTEVFKQWGCSADEISKIFVRRRALKNYNIPILVSKLKVFSELGLTSSDLVKIFNCHPRFFSCRIDHPFDDRLKHLQDFFGSKEVCKKAITRNPSLLTYDFDATVKPIIELYNRMGISRDDLIMMLLSRPKLITHSSLNDEKIEYIRRTRVSKDSKMYKYVVTLVAVSKLETIREKVANFEKFGFSGEEALRRFGCSPLLLTLSIDKVQRNMTFALGTLKLPARVVLEHPFLLFVNLEKVLKPRMLLAAKIQELGVAPQIKGPALLTALRRDEKCFVKLFIKCHPVDIANELMKYYKKCKTC